MSNVDWNLAALIALVGLASGLLLLVWLDTPTKRERERTEDTEGWWS